MWELLVIGVPTPWCLFGTVQPQQNALQDINSNKIC